MTGRPNAENQMSEERQNRQRIRCNRPGCRRGVSLVELLIVISVATVIVGICATTIHLLLRSERDQSRALRTAATLSRLSEVFREDVHATSKAVIEAVDGKAAHLTLTDADGRQIVYLPEENRLQRIETARDVEVHRDTYHFPSGTSVRVETDESPRMVRVAIDVAAAIPHQMPEGRNRLAPSRTVLIEALSNRDHRFAGRGP